MTVVRRKPGPALGTIRPGSMTDRAWAWASERKAFGYAEIRDALCMKRPKDIDDVLHRLMTLCRIRPVSRGRYAVVEDCAALREDGHLAIVWDGREIVVPPPMVERIRETLR